MKEKIFDCRYGMYLKNRGLESVVVGVDIIDAIKKRNVNYILLSVTDEDGTEYIVKEHDKPDSEGYFNYYWVDSETGEVLYDENSTRESEYVKQKNFHDSIKASEPIDMSELDLDDETMHELLYGRHKRGDYPDIIETKKDDTVTLDITTYRDISVGAVHYYGDLTFSGGKIELVRLITDVDEEKHPGRFQDFEINNYPTNCFDSIEDVIAKGKEIFNKRFEGKWNLKIVEHF